MYQARPSEGAVCSPSSVVGCVASLSVIVGFVSGGSLLSAARTALSSQDRLLDEPREREVSRAQHDPEQQ